MEFSVRAFDAESLGDGETLAGRIAGGAYSLVVNGHAYPVVTKRVDSDEVGVFAVVEEGKWEIGPGLLLKVEAFLDEDDAQRGCPPGCTISLVEPGPRELAERAARAAGLDPQAVNVLVPSRLDYSVDFNSGGHANGWAGGGLYPRPSPTAEN